jgi:multiple sugar transport system ATP-binding protein
MATVSLKSLCKRYPGGDALAVDSVNLEVDHGEFMVLLGPSGCGKSTTLRMVAGLESISSGHLAIDGKRMNEVPAKDRDIAMVFQSYALYPHMSVFDNLAFGLRRRDFSSSEIDKRVADVAATLGMAELLKRKPHALSGGQRQRVALGRAIVRDPKVFLFDEPLSNLDAALRVGMRGELIKLHHRLGATMIYVTHDQVEAMTMGDRICIMNGGKVVQIGAPLEVYRNPADTFVASFLGSPPTNLIPSRFDSDALQVGEAKLRMERKSPVENPVFGIRPEDIRVHSGLDAAPHVHGEVLAVEPLGAETLLRVRLAGVAGDVMVRGPRTLSATVGERVPLAFDLAAAHLFHPDTQRRI